MPPNLPSSKRQDRVLWRIWHRIISLGSFLIAVNVNAERKNTKALGVVNGRGYERDKGEEEKENHRLHRSVPMPIICPLELTA